MSVNVQILMGVVGTAPELKNGGRKNAVCKFSLVTEHFEKAEKGDKKVSTWHNVVCFGKKASTVNKYFKKGMEVHVQGRTEHRAYEKDGEKKYYSQVVLSEFSFTRASKPEVIIKG